MIDEKKLIEDLIPILNKQGDMYFAGRIIGLIDTQPKIRDWTLCAEKLPKNGVVYELSCKYLNQNYVTIGYCKDGKPVHSYIDDNSMFKSSEVIAWRKFGEPYNGQ